MPRVRPPSPPSRRPGAAGEPTKGQIVAEARAPGDGDGVVASLSALAELLLGGRPLAGALPDVVDLLSDRLPVAAASVTVRRARDFYTAASSHAIAEVADERQYADGVGPCMDCLRQGTEVSATDMRAETRWDGYPRRAVDLGLLSSHSLPLQHGGEVLGALNLYLDRPGGLDAESVAAARRVVAHTAVLLAAALRLTEQGELVAQLQQAMESREDIARAIGVVMAREGVTAEQAMGLLRSASQHSNVPVRELAHQLLGRWGGASLPERPVAGG